MVRDELVRLIDEILDENPSGALVAPRPAETAFERGLRLQNEAFERWQRGVHRKVEDDPIAW